MMPLLLLLILILHSFISVSGLQRLDFNLIRTFHHDAQSFTQGIVIRNGFIYESGGLYRRSSLQRVCASTGVVLQSTPLPPKYFAEGIALIDNHIFMLTWREKTMLIFDVDSLQLVDSRSYNTWSGEGWGLTFDGNALIASDGSHMLNRFELPSTDSIASSSSMTGKLLSDNAPKLKLISQVPVTYKGKNVKLVNELEYVEGFLYANIWYQDIIMKIDPTSGEVVARFDMGKLYPMNSRARNADCLNGIAFNKTDRSFLLTGKNWPTFYKVNFNELQ